MRFSMHLVRILAALALLATACAPQQQGGQPAAPAGATTAPAAAAKPSGKVTVYSALNESTNNAFVDAFKKATPGIDVEIAGRRW
jgi:ABC-type glycerol-3-phosphate transport system substrate-binding protein